MLMDLNDILYMGLRPYYIQFKSDFGYKPLIFDGVMDLFLNSYI